MRKSLRIASMVLAALLFFSYNSLKAQVKIGGNPAAIDPAAILELESTKKGLLLPRVDDAGMAAISASLNPGFLVYYTGGGAAGAAGLFVKVGTTMVRVSTETGGGVPWKQDGNLGSASSFLGTTNAFPLKLNANGNTGITIGTDGKLIFGFVDAAAPTENDVLVITGTGIIQKKTLGLAVTSVNGIKNDVHIGFSADESYDKLDTISTGQDLTLNIPILNGTTPGQNYGLMRLDDWNKLKNITSAGGITMDAIVDEALPEGAKLVLDATNGTWKLSLNEASLTNPGIVTAANQTFGGNKTFSGTTTFFDVTEVNISKSSVVGGAGPANLFVEGNVKFPGLATEALVSGNTYNILLKNTTSDSVKTVPVPGWKLTSTGIGQITTSSPTPATGNGSGDLAFEAVNSGSDFAITSTIANKVTFALPDAADAPGARGLVTAAAQTFGGDKSFTGKVHVGPAATPTSNFNINGSIGVKFRTMPAGGGSVGPDDYIVLAAANSAATALTLPDATLCSGRVYVIKRIPGSTPATEEDNNLVITPSGGQTINGVATTSITVVHTSITVMSDGANWQLLSRGTGF